MRVTLRLSALRGRSGSGAGAVPWLWPVFFALDDRALRHLLAGRPLPDDAVRPHPPVRGTSSAAPATHVLTRQGPLAMASFEMEGSVLVRGGGVVGVGVLLEEGDRPSEEGREAYEAFVAGLRQALVQDLGQASWLGGLGPGGLGGFVAELGGLAGVPPGQGTAGGPASPTPGQPPTLPFGSGEDAPWTLLAELAGGPAHRILDDLVPPEARERTEALTLLGRLVREPERDPDEVVQTPKPLRGRDPFQLGTPYRPQRPSAPEDPEAPGAPDAPGRPPGGSGDPPGGPGRPPIGPRPLPGHPPLPGPLPLPVPADPRPPIGGHVVVPLPGMDPTPITLRRRGSGIVASLVRSWPAGELSDAVLDFEERLAGDPGLRASYTLVGAVRPAVEGAGRPSGWARGGQFGAGLAVRDRSGGILVLDRAGDGVVKRQRLQQGAGEQAPRAGLPAGGGPPATGVLHEGTEVVVWQDGEGRIRGRERRGDSAWRVAALLEQARAPEADGALSLVPGGGPGGAVLLFRGPSGEVHAMVRDARGRWSHALVAPEGSAASDPTGATFSRGRGVWAAWADPNGTLRLAVGQDPARWQLADLATGRQAVSVLTAGVALEDPVDGVPTLVARTPEGLRVLRAGSGTWSVTAPKTGEAPSSAGDPAAAMVVGEDRSSLLLVAYEGVDGRIHALLGGKDRSWRHHDLTRVARAGRAGGPPTAWADPTRGTLHVAWVDPEGHLWEAERLPDGRWRSADLDALADLAAGGGGSP